MNVGIIGYGKMGRIRAMAVEACGGTVVRVHDPGVPSCTSSEEDILGDGSIDAVFVCTPNHHNKRLTIAALNAGKHVFCEKPPAFTATEVEEIMSAEDRSGRKLMYGFNHRHHGSVMRMKSAIDAGEYGRVLWMRGRYGKCVDSAFYDGWRANREMAGGGILIDQGIHMLDLFLHLAGDFDGVQAAVSNQYWKIDGIEDNVFAILSDSGTGVTASLHSTMTQWRHLFSLEVFLERGYMTLNGLKTPSGAYGSEVLTVAQNRTGPPAASFPVETTTVFEVDDSWESEVSHFFSCIMEDRPVETGTSSDALRLMRIIDKIYENR